MMTSPSSIILLTAVLSTMWISPLQALNPKGHGPAAAKTQLEALQTPEGLEVQLFASEPMVVNPTNLDIDANGRVWVTEGANYRLWQPWGKLRPKGDRIVILEDTDQDGEADKSTLFYQGNDVNAALGICVLGNRVIVACSPNLLIFTDTDGDDKADKKEVLFTGIDGVDHDHGVHAAIFGPDGKLYFNFGNNGSHIFHANGSPVTDPQGQQVIGKGKPYRQGMVFRCNLDGSQFQVVGHNFRNNYEVAIDSFGTLWQSDNDDDGNSGVRINYVMEYGNYGYRDELTGGGWQEQRANMEDAIAMRHWHANDPGVVPNLLQTGAGSPTGITVYEGTLLPEIFHNQIIHCDAGPRVVRAYITKADGAGYSATIKDILTSEDTWFRPSDVGVAPDGSLMIADWNDAGVGGHHMADQKLSTLSGRIYRVTVAENRQYHNEPAKLESAKHCVEALKSPNLATRQLAWTHLHAMQSKAEPELISLWQSHEPRQRARALHLLARIKDKPQHYLIEAHSDPDPNIRALALRIARSLQSDITGMVQKLVKDVSPLVRRECAIALRYSQSPEAPKLWSTLAKQHDGEDRWYLEALGIGAHGNEESYFRTWLSEIGSEWNTPAGRDIVWRSRSRAAPALLVKIIKDPQTTAAGQKRYFRALDFIEGPEKDAALLQLLNL
jgi:putative membrane-bound dehydrogenase-like protein